MLEESLDRGSGLAVERAREVWGVCFEEWLADEVVPGFVVLGGVDTVSG